MALQNRLIRPRSSKFPLLQENQLRLFATFNWLLSLFFILLFVTHFFFDKKLIIVATYQLIARWVCFHILLNLTKRMLDFLIKLVI